MLPPPMSPPIIPVIAVFASLTEVLVHQPRLLAAIPVLVPAPTFVASGIARPALPTVLALIVTTIPIIMMPPLTPVALLTPPPVTSNQGHPVP